MGSLIIPALFGIAGLVIYSVSTNGKAMNIGDRMMTCGLLVSLFVVAHETVKLFSR